MSERAHSNGEHPGTWRVCDEYGVCRGDRELLKATAGLLSASGEAQGA